MSKDVCTLVQTVLPADLIKTIHSYIPQSPKKKKLNVSPSMQKELTKLQSVTLKGKNGMYLRDLDDFCLD